MRAALTIGWLEVCETLQHEVWRTLRLEVWRTLRLEVLRTLRLEVLRTLRLEVLRISDCELERGRKVSGSAREREFDGWLVGLTQRDHLRRIWHAKRGVVVMNHVDQRPQCRAARGLNQAPHPALLMGFSFVAPLPRRPKITRQARHDFQTR